MILRVQSEHMTTRAGILTRILLVLLCVIKTAFAAGNEHIVVSFTDGTSAEEISAFTRDYNLKLVRHLAFKPGTFEFRPRADMDSQVLRELQDLPMVEKAYLPQRVYREPRSVDPFLSEQWYLDNYGQLGGCNEHDLNISTVVETGAGVVIAVVDDGLELDHPDLLDRTAGMSAYHYDYLDNDTDPTAGEHGTAIAGIAAATADNGIGIQGVAPAADLLGIRVLGTLVTGLEEANALGHQSQIVDISNNSWGVPDDSIYLDRPGELARLAMQAGVDSGRGGLGVNYVWSAGNGGADSNTNYDGYANSPYVIAVTATNDCGQETYYSEPGTNIMLNTPGSGWYTDVFTTDRTGVDGYNDGLGGWLGEPDDGDYTGTFGGTSASTPMVSGIIARMLEAKPQLSWRDVRRILIETVWRNDPSHTGWQLNAANYWFNPYYGFGRVDAAAAVDAARGWETGIDSQQASYPVTMQATTIPQSTGSPLHSSVDVAANYVLEDVSLSITSDHSDWSDLTVVLVSPSGTRSVLNTGQQEALMINLEANWQFSSLEFYGEPSVGTWALEVSDEEIGETGSLTAWELVVRGIVVASGQGDIAPLDAPDGRINIADALMALRIALGLQVVTDPTIITNADLAPEGNPDGVVSVADALMILRIALGLAA